MVFEARLYNIMRLTGIWAVWPLCCGVWGVGVVCSLGGNGLGAEGARALASCLGDLTGLQTLKYVG